MCFGPIAIHWYAPEANHQALDTRLILLLAADFVEMNPDQPHLADRNEFDFYFLARETLLNAKAEIAFWFPYRSQDTCYTSNDAVRTQQLLPFYLTFLEQGLRNPNPARPESFGWDQAEIRRWLPHDGPDTATVIREQLQALSQPPTPPFAPEASVSIRPLRFPGDGAPDHQHYLASLTGNLRQNDIFHVSFKLTGASTRRLGRYSGEAGFNFYSPLHHPLIGRHPLAPDPLLPCLMLHVAFRSATPLASFTTATGAPPTFVSVPHVGDQPAVSPTGYRYRDMYWYTLFNAHRGYQGGTFDVRWRYASADPSVHLNTSLRLLISTLDLRPVPHQTVITSIVEQLELGRLTTTQLTILRGLAVGKTAAQLAAERQVAVKTVRNYYDLTTSILGLKGVGLDPKTRHELISHAVRLQQELELHNITLSELRQLFASGF